MSYLVLFVLVFFSPFSIAITSHGEERANLSAFRTFARICACLDLSVSSSSWCLGRAAVCDCGTPWTFFLPCFYNNAVTEIADVCHIVMSLLCRLMTSLRSVT